MIQKYGDALPLDGHANNIVRLARARQFYAVNRGFGLYFFDLTFGNFVVLLLRFVLLFERSQLPFGVNNIVF